MKKFTRRFAVLMLAGLLSVRSGSAGDTIYHNGTIVTLNERNDTVEAVAVRDPTIIACGSLAEVRKVVSDSASLVDLRGRTLLPGFYAAHDHFLNGSVSSFYHVDLNSPPIGRIENLDEMIAVLRERAAVTPAGEWIVGRGYDDTLIREQR